MTRENTGNTLIDNITTDNFRNFFERDFLFRNNYDSEETYNTGDEVYFNRIIYVSLINNNTGNPINDTNSWQATTQSIDDIVLESDILRAYDTTLDNFNVSIFQPEQTGLNAYLWATAHNIVMSFQARGIDDVSLQRATNTSVGNVSEGLNINEKLSQNPILEYYYKTSYGQRYLQLLVPRLVGGVQNGYGATRA